MLKTINDIKDEKLLYICDRKKCEHCIYTCKYTADINHAKYRKENRIFQPGMTYDAWEEIEYSDILEVVY